MKNINIDELLNILTYDKKNCLNFAIETENVNGAKNSIFNLIDAFEPDLSKNVSEFMAVFVDSPVQAGGFFISVNAESDKFAEECADKIYQIINNIKADNADSVNFMQIKLTLHKNDKIITLLKSKYTDVKFTEAEIVPLCSFYYDSAIKADMPKNLKIRTLSAWDKSLCDEFDKNVNDNYLSIIFDYSILNPKYSDCGIIGYFNTNGELAGYLSYYGITGNIRDVSYIYTGENLRRNGYGKTLLNFFKNNNINNGKISYYSYSENEYSEKLVKSCGFLPCSYRYEYEIEI